MQLTSRCRLLLATGQEVVNGWSRLRDHSQAAFPVGGAWLQRICLPSGLRASVVPSGGRGELPATAVDADVVMELADQDEVVRRGIASVFLVPQVVDVAVDGGAAAAGPGAVAVAELDGAADVPGDGV